MPLVHINLGIGSGGVGTSTVNLECDTNLNTTGSALSFQLFNPNSPATFQAVNLTTGANTFNTTTCPALASAGGVWIIPPFGQGQSLTIKGVSGDTGLSMFPGGAPMFWPLASSPQASFVITAGGSVTGLILGFV